MERNTLGRTGLEVSVAGLGCGGPSRLGQAGDASDSQGVAVVQAALDAGVTLFDTSSAYGTEHILGKALRGRRDKAVLCTKVPPLRRSWLSRRRRPLRAKELRKALEASLKRLGTDYLDLYLLHAVTLKHYASCRESLLPELRGLQEQGKLRYFGISEAYLKDPGHRMLAQALSDDDWDVVLFGFSLLNVSAREAVLTPARERNVGTIAAFAAREVLARKGQEWPVEARRIVDAAYRFCRHEPGVHAVLSGTGSLEHLSANLASLDGAALSEEERRWVAGLFDRCALG